MNELSPFTHEAFEQFAGLANKGNLHPKDWDRFYQFVITCHRYQLKRTGHQLRPLFQRAGFGPYWVDEMVSAYDHCRAVLRVRGPVVRRRYF